MKGSTVCVGATQIRYDRIDWYQSCPQRTSHALGFEDGLKAAEVRHGTKLRCNIGVGIRFYALFWLMDVRENAHSDNE